MPSRSATFSFGLVLCCFWLKGGDTSREDITFTDKSWKDYISKDHDPAWKNGTDELALQG
jgi:hypothetical protein